LRRARLDHPAEATNPNIKAIQRFTAATKVLVEYNAMVNRLMGDQVIGLFVPRRRPRSRQGRGRSRS
jgi:hypothetical protein